ncbi:hypothetical protein [Massilia sp.]|uniref:hypothetical protein n=1 Tax=Massilia sp. TaxID=1882437 RepID=UPI0028AA390C|nr:hypothetical protein [Massilia sp.]
MSNPRQSSDPAARGGAILHEDDIGSGEKTPAQKETEEMIRQIPPLPSGEKKDQGEGKA